MLSFRHYKMIDEQWILSGSATTLDESIKEIWPAKSLKITDILTYCNTLENTFHKV